MYTNLLKLLFPQVSHNSRETDDPGEDEILSRGSKEDTSEIRGSEQETQRLINRED